MSRESLEPEKKKKGDGEKGRGFKCEVMEREAVTGGVHAVPVLACGSARVGSSLICLRTWKEGDMGCEEGSYQRGLSHCVKVTPQKTHCATALHSGQPVSPPVLP